MMAAMQALFSDMKGALMILDSERKRPSVVIYALNDFLITRFSHG